MLRLSRDAIGEDTYARENDELRTIARRLSAARDAHALSSVIGDHHDLSVLRQYVEANPQLFSDMASRAALLTVLDRRRDKLQRRALKLGRRLYEQPPKRFAKAVERGWRKRVGDRAEV